MILSAVKGKSDWLARLLYWSGGAAAAARLRQLDTLIVLNYHSIGDYRSALFDPAVYSATAEEFHDQVSYLKRTVSLVSLEEALDFALRPPRPGPARCRVLLTFDDGYADNYDAAYPILRSQGVQGVFFLTTGMVGRTSLPWWDRVAHIVMTARLRKFALRTPAHLDVDLDRQGLRVGLRNILKLYKRPENPDTEVFIAELRNACGGSESDTPSRRFLGWEQAREMLRGGMAIGSHTHTHAVLSQLTAEQQWDEVSQSRLMLKEHCGVDAEVLSYPVGNTFSFTGETQDLVRQAGYRAAFSFYGGANFAGAANPYDMHRFSVSPCSPARFRVRVSTARFNGRMWP